MKCRYAERWYADRIEACYNANTIKEGKEPMEDAGTMLFIILAIALAVFYLIAWWKLFAKAGQPGWACIIPIYNTYILLKMAGKPGWWLLLFLIPLVNFILAFIVWIEIAKAFGQGTGFGVGLVLLGFIFLPILAFGDYKYSGPPMQA